MAPKPCPSCGSNDHKNGRERQCPKYLPVEDRSATSTVCSSVNGHLRDSEMGFVLGVAADKVSKVAYRVLVFLNTHLVRLVGNELPIPTVDLGYLTKLSFLFVTGNPQQHHPDTEMLATMAAINTVVPKIPGTGLSHLLDAMRTDLLTAINNFDKHALKKHIAIYLHAKYGIKRGHGSSLADKVFRFGVAGFYTTGMPNTMEGTVEYWNNIIKEEHELFKLLACDRGELSYPKVVAFRAMMLTVIEDKDTIDKTYKKFSLAPLRSEGRKFIQITNAAMPQLGALAKELIFHAQVRRRAAKLGLPPPFERDPDVRNEDGLPPDVLPESFQSLDAFFNRKGKLVDHTGGIHRTADGSLVMEQAKVGRRLRRNKNKNKRKRKNKRACKKVYKAVGMNPERWQLADSVKTNGIELHLVFRSSNWPTFPDINKNGKRSRRAGRPVTFLPSNMRIKPADLNPTYAFPDNIALDELTASDPGITSPFTKCWTNYPSDEMRTKSLTSKQYGHEAGRYKINKRVARDRKRFSIDHILALYSRCTLKTTDSENVLEAARHRFQSHDLMHKAHSQRQNLKLRFECRRRTMRANDKAVNFLRHSPKVKLVVIGDAGRLYGLKGTSGPAPVKKIKRIAVKRGRNEGFVVADFNEGCTSCKSCCCHGHRTKHMPDHNPPRLDGKQRQSDVYGILICEGCGKLWARDVNAALNIWAGAWYKIMGYERPFWLRTWHANTGL
jgi:hypothetical protein